MIDYIRARSGLVFPARLKAFDHAGTFTFPDGHRKEVFDFEGLRVEYFTLGGETVVSGSLRHFADPDGKCSCNDLTYSDFRQVLKKLRQAFGPRFPERARLSKLEVGWQFQLSNIERLMNLVQGFPRMRTPLERLHGGHLLQQGKSTVHKIYSKSLQMRDLKCPDVPADLLRCEVRYTRPKQQAGVGTLADIARHWQALADGTHARLAGVRLAPALLSVQPTNPAELEALAGLVAFGGLAGYTVRLKQVCSTRTWKRRRATAKAINKQGSVLADKLLLNYQKALEAKKHQVNVAKYDLRPL